jgi:hypothetical protein
MIPLPIRKKIGDDLLATMLAVQTNPALTREDNARRVLQTLMPYLKKPAEHSLTKMHVSALFKLRAAVQHYGRNKIHIRKQMYDAKGAPFQLSTDEWSNFTKLRYFALAVHAEKGKTRGGYWTLTTLGAAFLRGEKEVAKHVYTYCAHPVAHSDETVHITGYKAELPDFENFYDFTPRPSSATQTARLFG